MKSNLADNGAVQDTEIGPIPTDWRLVRLRDVTFEGTDRNRDLEYSRSDVLGVDNEEGLIPSDRLLGDDFSRYKLVRKHQFAYNPMRLNVGSIGLWGKDETAIVSPDYIVFGCRDDELDPDFMDLFRRSATWEWQIRQSGQGSVRIRYYYRHIGEFFVPLPPLKEQRTIAHFLRTVQRARETNEKVIVEARQLKQSLMEHLFTYGVIAFDHADRVSQKETDIGPLPEQWAVRPLEDIADLVSGGTPSKQRPDFWQGTIPWASPKDLKSPRLWDAQDHISQEGLQDGSRLVPPGSLFIVIRGMILTKSVPISMAMVPMAFNQDMKAVLPKAGVDPEYLLYALIQYRSFLTPEIGTSAHGTRRIGTSAIGSLLLPVPSEEEQKSIANAISAVDKKIQVEEGREACLAALFDSLLHQLMTGQVRVHDLALPASEAV